MKLFDPSTQVASIELAGALLRAWVRGDRRAFEMELDRSSQTQPEQTDTGEEERLQILSAIAARLKACDDPFSPESEDAAVDVCANLLSHLAGPHTPNRAHCAGRHEPGFRSGLNRPDFVHSIRIRTGTAMRG